MKWQASGIVHIPVSLFGYVIGVASIFFGGSVDKPPLEQVTTVCEKLSTGDLGSVNC